MSDRTPASVEGTPEVWVGLSETRERVTGWSSVVVTRAIDSCADAYRLTLDWDPTAVNRARFVPFSPAEVRIFIDNEVVLTGYVERLTTEVAGDERSLSVEGRGKSGVLLDWSAGGPGRGYEFQDVTFNTVARELAHPHRVVARPDTPRLPIVEFEAGDTVYEVLSGLAAGHGLFASPQRDGSLSFVRFSSRRRATVELEEGLSPMRMISSSFDATKRFQEYVVYGHTDSVPIVSAAASDPERLGVEVRGRRVRRLTQQTQDINAAATFERNRALIDSFRLYVTVSGWTHGRDLWEPGEIVRLTSPGAMIYRSARFIVSRVTLRMDAEEGQEADLELSIPEAYDDADIKPGALPWRG